MLILNWAELGAALCNISDDEQSKFFYGFAHELASRSFESNFKRECQMISIGKRLDPKSKEILAEFLPAIWFKE